MPLLPQVPHRPLHACAALAVCRARLPREHIRRDLLRFAAARDRDRGKCVPRAGNTSRPSFDTLSSLRASHFVRDRRDTIVSGCHDHLQRKERWCPDPSFDRSPLAAQPAWGKHNAADVLPGAACQALLNRLAPEQGAAPEIVYRQGPLHEMAPWLDGDGRSLDLRYEDLAGNGSVACARTTSHYQLRPSVAARGLEPVETHSLTTARRGCATPNVQRRLGASSARADRLGEGPDRAARPRRPARRSLRARLVGSSP